MDELEFQLKEEPGKLAIESPIFGVEGSGVDSRWSLSPIDEHRYMLTSVEADLGMGGAKDGFGQVPISVFHTFIQNLISSGWSGVLSVDTGFGAKRLYFAAGDIVFAASNIIDDRLGEVMYRHSMITIEELTTAAAHVDKTKKFGQVLLSSGVFSHVNLWSALKRQVREIIRSLFLVETVYYEMGEGGGTTPTAVVFEEGSRQVVNETFAFGCQVREFLSRLTAESRVRVSISEQQRKSYNPGTFVGDMLALIDEKDLVQDLLNSSKLMDINTISALYLLVSRNFCTVEPMGASERRGGEPKIKARIDAYHYVLNSVLRRFDGDNQAFPLRELETFVTTLNAEDFVSLYLGADGTLHPDSVGGIFAQSVNQPERVRHFELRIECMIQFLLQVTGDRLSWDDAHGIRSEYYSLMV